MNKRFEVIHAHDGREYLIHLAVPMFVARVRYVQPDESSIEFFAKEYPVGAITNVYNGKRALIQVVSWIDKPDFSTKIEKLMSRTGDWYFQNIMLKITSKNDN